MFKLYYYPNNASLAPHFLLQHVKADFELLLVDKKAQSHKKKNYLRLNPAGRIPTLIVDGQAVFESIAICIHLCELHPDSGLMPALGDVKRPLFFQWLAFLNNTLQSELMIRYYPKRHTTSELGVSDIVSAQNSRIMEVLSILDEQLKQHEYLIGKELTACDYFLFMLAGWLPEEANVTSYQHLSDYLKRLCRNPVIRAVCDFEGIDLTPFESYS
ncbi:glutathione S-transferase family protein [Vibrio sp. F74]|uniref:glutathione S-transferase family protein n=1 Tax=Vibrio sp. F74 TaxID=700020 RepID=UPI0035F5E090